MIFCLCFLLFMNRAVLCFGRYYSKATNINMRVLRYIPPLIRGQVCCRLGGKDLGVGDGLFEPKGGVKRILLKGELKIFQQRGAKLPLGHTLNWGVQMKKISFGGGKKNFSYGILNTCPRMILNEIDFMKKKIVSSRKWNWRHVCLCLSETLNTLSWPFIV